MKEQQARPCVLCQDTDLAFGNVVKLWTREAFGTHVRDRHPGLDPRTLWAFPLKAQRPAVLR